MAEKVTSWFVPQNLLDMVPSDQAQAAADQARNTFLFGLLSNDPGAAYNTAQTAGYNVLSHASALAEAQRKQAVQNLLTNSVNSAIETAPGTGVGTADPRFAPRDVNGQELAGPGYVPPVNKFNFNKFAADPNVARALATDPAALEKLTAPQIDTANGWVFDKRTVQPGTYLPKFSENVAPQYDKNGNMTGVAPVAGSVNAVGQFEGAKAGAQESAKANYDLAPITLQSATMVNGQLLPAGTVLNATRLQQVNAAKTGQPFIQSLAPGVKTEMENQGKFNIEQMLTPAKAASDAAETANKQLSVMEQLVRNTNLNQITGNESVQKLAGYAKAAGWLTPEAAAQVGNLSSLKGQLSGVVLNDQLAQKGPQTESDARRMEQTINGANDIDATKFLIAARRAQNNVAQDRYKFLNEFRDKSGTLTGADIAWNNARGKESLFRQPELKSYAPIYEIDGKKYRVYGDGGKPELVQ
jgi:hypothetical protein